MTTESIRLGQIFDSTRAEVFIYNIIWLQGMPLLGSFLKIGAQPFRDLLGV